MNTQGDDYEARAAGWLEANGLVLVQRNFRARSGEIDIIARDGDCLVFIEVRARNNRAFASAAASVDRRKQQRIVRTAQWFLQRQPEWASMPCRFDVIAFEPRQSAGGAGIHWIRAAFTT